MAEYYNMDSFTDLPANWKEICDYLNGILNERITDDMGDDEIHDAMNQLWDDYWGGKLENAPVAMEEAE